MKIQNLDFFIYIFALIFVSMDVKAESASTLELYFHNKAPYYYQENNQVKGKVIDLLKSSLQKTEINIRFVKSSPERQMHLLKENHGNKCYLGWYKNSEREQFAKFSKPIYKDLGYIGLIHKNNQKLQNIKSLKELFSINDWLWIKNRNYSYGSYIDQLSQKHTNTRELGLDLESLLKIIVYERADLLIVTKEEAEYLQSKYAYLLSNIQNINFVDAPSGDLRYLMCNSAIDNKLLQSINAQLSSSHF